MRSGQNQRATYSLNQSMTNGLPALTPEKLNFCISQFYRKRATQRFHDSPSNELQTGRPSLPLYKDVEQLKDEIIHLKRENLKLQQQNQKLHFQIKLDEKEQYDKKTTQEYSDDQIPQNQRLIEKLKQARLIIQEKQAEIDQMKRSTRYMRLQDMENELANTKVKFEILNKQFNEILKTEHDINKFQKLTVQIIEQEEKIRQLGNSYQKQKKKVLHLRQELLTCQAMREKFRKQLETCQSEFEKYRKSHEQEIQRKTRYKEQIAALNQVLADKQAIIVSLQNEIDRQKLLVIQKQKQFKELEDQYQTKKSWLTNKREADSLFQDQLDEKVYKNTVLLTEEEVSVLQKSETKIVMEEDHWKERPQIPINRISMDSKREEIPSQMQSSKQLKDIEIVKQKLPRVNHYDVEEIGKQIKYQLMIQQISFEQLDSFFEQKHDLTVMELVEILSAFPFNITSNKQAVLLARYLIEDNTQQTVEFTPLECNDAFVIRSVLKNIIGKYQLFNEESSKTIWYSISQQIWKFRQSIVEQIKIITMKKNNQQYSDYCDEDDFKNSILQSNILLDYKQKEFLGYYIYKEFGGNKLFDYKSLIDKFETPQLVNTPPKNNLQ